MTAQFARAPHVASARNTPPVYNAPHAALLIDFDNVTMGIRSDLTKELKNLLNSDIIKGKVAVQRAYADWRRYPQYIVPLAENSVDLIFAPAYGTSKKNATDIRLSIDALELVFTRPEIGTFILLSGDSDFSSLVLKLKEYGKYVIGVGIRESASDLLVQNCDEYYSYSALTGLTRAGDEEVKAWDPWECVEVAVQRMAEHNDVMRSDRLKQVMLELDPNFDEKALGFTKFNRFVQEAESRGLLELNKLENGQFEVAPVGSSAAEPTTPAPAPSPAAAVESVAEAPKEERKPKRPDRLTAPTPERPLDLKAAYDLLRAATKDVSKNAEPARDSDVKRRILELRPDWSEPALGFSKFSRFLRQAHDAEVINLRKLENGNYEIILPGSAAAAAAVPDEGGRGRGRGRKRGGDEERAPRENGRGRRDKREGGRGRPDKRERAHHQLELSETQTQPPAPAQAPETQTPAPARAPAPGVSPAALGIRSSRGRRPNLSGPPPLLPGQAVGAAAPQKQQEAEKPKKQRAAAAPKKEKESAVKAVKNAVKKAVKKATTKKAAPKKGAKSKA